MTSVNGMSTIVREHTKGRSPLTVQDATAKSRVALAPTEEAIPDPSEFRVGSFHVPTDHATTVPTLCI